MLIKHVELTKEINGNHDIINHLIKDYPPRATTGGQL